MMKKRIDYENLSVFEQVKIGLEQCMAHSRGELNLKTTTLPAPPPPVSQAAVIALRRKLKMSQSIFAAALNVSTKLVQSWEQGLRKPDRGELRLIQILIKRPDILGNVILAGAPGPLQPRPGTHKPLSRKGATAA